MSVRNAVALHTGLLNGTYYTIGSDYGYRTFFLLSNYRKIEYRIGDSRNYWTIGYHGYQIKASIYRTIRYGTQKKLSVAHLWYTYTVCRGGGERYGVLGPRQINTCRYRSFFFRWLHFALPSMSLIFLRYRVSFLFWTVIYSKSIYFRKFNRTWITFDAFHLWSIVVNTCIECIWKYSYTWQHIWLYLKGF
jgi:hypothetical protein